MQTARKGEAKTGLWLNKLGTIKKNHSAWRNRGIHGKKGTSWNKKERGEEMGTQTERRRRIKKSPQRRPRENEKNGKPTKALGIAYCRACAAFAIHYHSPLPNPPHQQQHHSHTLSHLAWVVLNLGTLTSCQAWCNRRESCPAEPCGRLLRVPSFPWKLPQPISWSSSVFGSHPRGKERSDERRGRGFKTSISLRGGARRRLQLCAN